ncbi:MAG: tRNA pseudouridine synthase [Pseudonocardiales bacterium]|nr:tRNA pseudouridine synthase [Pseudonocardiales bacterium]
MTDPKLADDQPVASGNAGPSLDAFRSKLRDPVRVRLDIAYDGSDFSGWAVQPDRRSVQGDLEEALGRILRLPSVRLTVAGRTDAGVHAIAQVAHFDIERELWEAEQVKMIRRLGGILKPDLRVYAANAAPLGFDARFSASWRRYEFRVTDAVFGAEPLRRHDTLAWPRRLDVDAMNEAAQTLLGVHDFAAYCRYREGATTVRGLLELQATRVGDVITVEAKADAFCHSMVRSLVGALIGVGEGHQKRDWPASLLALRSRSGEVRVAAARGLTLMEVRYPPAEEMAARAALTRSVRGPVH